MEDRFKKSTVELSNVFQKVTASFLLSIVKEEENTSDLINVALSAHVSALFSTMKLLSLKHESIKKTVDEFIEKTTEFLKTAIPQSSIEIDDNYRLSD